MPAGFLDKDPPIYGVVATKKSPAWRRGKEYGNASRKGLLAISACEELHNYAGPLYIECYMRPIAISDRHRVLTLLSDLGLGEGDQALTLGRSASEWV